MFILIQYVYAHDTVYFTTVTAVNRLLIDQTECWMLLLGEKLTENSGTFRAFGFFVEPKQFSCEDQLIIVE